MKKTIMPGRVQIGKYLRPVHITIDIEKKDKGLVLSISGIEGALRSGNAYGGCGQIDVDYAHRNPKDNDPRYTEFKHLVKFAPGWTEDLWFDLLDIWERWHLNDMNAECEHQRARGETWETNPLAICPDCGYKLGSAWQYEPLPDSVVNFIRSLPDPNIPCAWD